ncbi:MAG: putative DNA binding domain-containing protein [Muribaculaceae bacterium]|nr:putative DNA binding domain-containing protein [Muribaculaceae bacterium]
MALPINITDLLNKQKIESNRIEFKKGWNPESVYHSICAFANDFDEIGGGYILVGVDADNETGMAIRPVEGVSIEKIDGILQDMVGYNNKFAPYYLPRTSVEEIDGKQVLVIWCPAGINRPYSIPENVTAKHSKEYFYIRSGTSSIIAKGDVLDELRELAVRVPFDERGNPDIKMEDISIVLLRDYLVKVGSKLENELYKRPLPEILEQMDLFVGPSERRMLRNVAAMMFCEHPEKIFKYTQVDIVICPKGRVNDPDNFSETTIYGRVPQLVNGALTHLKNTVIREFVSKQKNVPESLRFFNYPIQALEEAIVNSLYHRDYQQHEPVEISVEPNGIHILSFPGPDRSISAVAIEAGEMLHSRRYRNRRLGDFLKELDLTEGRSTGIPTIQNELKKNGSHRATIETNEERSFINVYIPIHEGCGDTVILNDPKNDPKDDPKKLSERQKLILQVISNDRTVTRQQLVQRTKISDSTIKRELSKLKELGYIERIGGKTFGHWEIKKQAKLQ